MLNCKKNSVIQPPVITVDGPSGSGKGTISCIIAKTLGWHFLDSGSLYRVMALAVKQQGVLLQDEGALIHIADTLDVHYKVDEKKQNKIYLGIQEVTEKIREEIYSMLASKVAAISGVRSALLAKQRHFRQKPGLIADGRDMGTVVFPDAILKIYLTASVEERARRRLQQLQTKNTNITYEEILAELIARDKRDADRAIAPLKPALDAVIIDTTNLSIEEVTTQVLAKTASILRDKKK